MKKNTIMGDEKSSIDQSQISLMPNNVMNVNTTHNMMGLQNQTNLNLHANYFPQSASNNINQQQML